MTDDELNKATCPYHYRPWADYDEPTSTIYFQCGCRWTKESYLSVVWAAAVSDAFSRAFLNQALAQWEKVTPVTEPAADEPIIR